ncbi:MAG: GHKL domain-containing protein [Selenomonadaceae bacterium]|nr:GHKL domain-containing protein [Selenomonadaceae bacterium]
MFDEIFLLDCFVYIAIGAIGFKYAEFFLKLKNHRIKSMFLWTLIFAMGELIYKNAGTFDNSTNILSYIILIGILSIVFFEKNIPRSAFFLASFTAGWEILRFTASPLAHAILGIWNPLWEQMINALLNSGVMQGENILSLIQSTNRIALFTTLLICRMVQLGMLYFYLKLIRKNFVAKDYELTYGEMWFLLIPCLTILSIDITLRVMAYSVDNSALMLIYERAPATLLLLPAVSVLLLGFTITAVILFKGLSDGKIEYRKRLLLENRMAEVRNRVNEIENIYGDMRGLKHDLRGAIANVAACINNNAVKLSDEVASYLKGMENIIARLDFLDNTGSPIVDAILSRFRSVCKAEKVSVDFSFHYPQNNAVNIYDLSVILDNALQNAVEAAAKVRNSPFVSLRSYEKGGLFFIEVENSFDGNLLWKKDSEIPATSKQNKDLHGIGLANVKRIAEKYSGDMAIDTEKGDGKNTFRLTVMLYKSHQGE